MTHPDNVVSRPGVESRLIVVQDQPQPCPYLQNFVARMPLRLPVGKLSDDSMDALLSLGFRRSGDFVYRTECAGCQACEPTRLIVEDYRWTRSTRRVLKNGDAVLQMEVQSPSCDAARVALFNAHRLTRGLARDEEPVDELGYRAFLVESCCQTIELSFWHEQRLVAVSIIDQANDSISAVYTYFDPSYCKLSLGTYSILKQIERCQTMQLTFLYLGMYVASNPHLNYKGRFLPQQRLQQGSWQPILS